MINNKSVTNLSVRFNLIIGGIMLLIILQILRSWYLVQEIMFMDYFQNNQVFIEKLV